MGRALSLARQGWGQVSPNPLVGAVVVRDGRIVGEGFHARFGSDHAEVVALRSAGDLARGATLYVTLEPCNHTGKTPPCSEAIITSGVKRVVVAMLDPNPEAGGGRERLVEAGIAVDVGLASDDAAELNAPFLNSFRSARPWITLKIALSIDSALADAIRSSGWISSPESRRYVHRMRAGVDAIAVGSATAAADDPALTVRGRLKPRTPPVRVVLARSRPLSPTSQLARTATKVPTWLMGNFSGATETAQLSEMGVRIFRSFDLGDAMRRLRGEGISSLLVEGGAQLSAALLNAGLVDRLVLVRAPILLGGAALGAFSGVDGVTLQNAVRHRVLQTRQLGGDTMTTYALTAI